MYIIVFLVPQNENVKHKIQLKNASYFILAVEKQMNLKDGRKRDSIKWGHVC